MKNFILTTIALSIITLTGYTQTKQESIKELVHLMQQDSVIEKVMSSMNTVFSAQVASLPNPEARARALEMMKGTAQMTNDIMKRFMDEDVVGIYDKNFSQQEIKDYIAFYKSPSGKKMLQAMPAVQKETMSIMMQKYMPQIMEEIKKRSEEMKKKMEEMKK